MRVVEIREKAVKLQSKLRNAAFSFDEMTTSLVAVVTDVVRAGKPIIGYAFNSTGRYACGAQMRDRLIPRLMREERLTLDPAAFDPDLWLSAMMFGEKPGGDMERSVAIGTIEHALWDAVGKIADKPVYQLIADRYRGGKVQEKVFCYVGGGWYAPGKTIQDLLDEVRRYLDMGYTLIKMKVGGAPLTEDLQRLEAVIGLLGDASRVAVDANCGIPVSLRPSYAAALKPLGLRWFEEPAHPNDYQGNADFIAAYGNAVATGENLFSLEDVRNLVRHGGMRPGTDIIQTDVPQSYGIGTAAKVLAMLEAHGWSASSVLPHGGNQMSFNQSAGFGYGMCEAYPDAFGVFSGYCDDLKVEDGYITSGDWPGMGFERQAELFKLFEGVTG
ncbi:enolase C-terminal domain-like protein [Aquabacter sp. CN5-332]|uniref:enolase C-terminal domain-like protein n=1 Tax=Aquabacter sp. CN5-332 TaxID=3156608 RepID=UPI0032B33C71